MALEKLASAKRELAASGSIETIQANLYEQDDMQRIVALTENHGRHIKYLVNAAGYFKPTSFLEHTPGDYDTYMGLNRAAFFISQAVARNMKANGGGSIVHIGSMWAKQAIKATPSSAYSMAKAALNQMTRLLAKSCAPVRVNAVAPGLVETPWTRDWQAQHEAVRTRAPLKRSAVADDCVEAALGLLRTRYATGHIFVVDGGLTLTM